jgi:hypothetical protein
VKRAGWRASGTRLCKRESRELEGGGVVPLRLHLFLLQFIDVFLGRCERALQSPGADAAHPDSATAMHVAATNQVNLALYTLHLWMWDDSSRHLQRAQELAQGLLDVPGLDQQLQPSVFSGYHCVVFGSLRWNERVACLQRVAQHIMMQTTRPFIALSSAPPPPHLLRVAYMSSDFAAHTTGANILGLFRR